MFIWRSLGRRRERDLNSKRETEKILSRETADLWSSILFRGRE